jgi:hypothetical protein
VDKRQHQLGGANTLNTLAQGTTAGGSDEGSGLEKRLGLLEKGLTEMKEKLLTVSSKADSIEKHFATRADLATMEINIIKCFVATTLAMAGLACAIAFGLIRLHSS